MRKYEVSYRTNITNEGFTGYFEKIYLKSNESESDLIAKIENRIRPSQTPTVYTYTEIKV